MADFDQVGREGGQINFDQGNTVRFSGQTLTPLAISQFIASDEGAVLDWVSMGGMSLAPPQLTIPVFITSDMHRMFGRSCPSCNSYFRMSGTSRSIQCPYCLNVAHIKEFMTTSQKEYVKAYCTSGLEAMRAGKQVTVNFGQSAIDSINASPWTYAEQQQQNSYTCAKCQCKFDILGEYGSCPMCGYGNWHDVWNRKLNSLDDRFAAAEASVTDRSKREEEWVSLLTSSVSGFEAMARDITKSLVLLPTTPRRKKRMVNVSFQRIDQASGELSNIYDIDIFDGLTDDNRVYFIRMFQQRHLFTHNGGVVDQEYIDNTQDTTVKLNQKLRLRSNEISRFLTIVRAVGLKLIDGYESIS